MARFTRVPSRLSELSLCHLSLINSDSDHSFLYLLFRIETIDDSVMIVRSPLSLLKPTLCGLQRLTCSHSHPRLQDTGAAYSCVYNNVGLNITIQVLGPYNKNDKVFLLYDLASDTTKTTYGTPLKASYRSARDGTPFIVSQTYSRLCTTCTDCFILMLLNSTTGCAFPFPFVSTDYTSADLSTLAPSLSLLHSFIPNSASLDIGNFAAQVTRADDSVHLDDRQGVFPRLATFLPQKNPPDNALSGCHPQASSTDRTPFPTASQELPSPLKDPLLRPSPLPADELSLKPNDETRALPEVSATSSAELSVLTRLRISRPVEDVRERRERSTARRSRFMLRTRERPWSARRADVWLLMVSLHARFGVGTKAD